MYEVLEISLDEVKRDLLSYLRLVETGKRLIILKAGKPVAEIIPVSSPVRGLRPYGLCAGEFVVPDDFDQPLPEEIVQDFEGK